MFFTKIWERYYLKKMCLCFLMFLFGFYALYILIDYSNHSGTFKHHHFSFSDIALFYAYEFVARMDLLVPFAILIAFIKTVSSANANNELVSLMASGIPLKILLRPFVLFALFFVLMIYFNTEVLQPLAVSHHNRLEESRAKKKQKKHKHPLVRQIALTDGTSIIFQRYDAKEKRIFDAYWIRSADDIYRIKYLFPYLADPLGEGVEHLERDEQGNLIVTSAHPREIFDKMHFNKKSFLETVSEPSELSLSALKRKLSHSGEIKSEKQAEIRTALYHKLAFPWLCLLAIIIPAPLCTRFSRTMPIFFIYTSCIFALVAFYIVMNAAVILGERQVIAPAAAIWIPFTLTFASFGYKYSRL